MSIACGCSMGAGQSVTVQQAREHAKHTFAVLLFWELLVGPGMSDSSREKLMNGRLMIQEVMDEIAPGWEEI